MQPRRNSKTMWTADIMERDPVFVVGENKPQPTCSQASKDPRGGKDSSRGWVGSVADSSSQGSVLPHSYPCFYEPPSPTQEMLQCFYSLGHLHFQMASHGKYECVFVAQLSVPRSLVSGRIAVNHSDFIRLASPRKLILGGSLGISLKSSRE